MQFISMKVAVNWPKANLNMADITLAISCSICEVVKLIGRFYKNKETLIFLTTANVSYYVIQCSTALWLITAQLICYNCWQSWCNQCCCYYGEYNFGYIQFKSSLNYIAL